MHDPMYLTEAEIEDLRREMREALGFMNELLAARGAGAAELDNPPDVAPQNEETPA